MEKSGKKRKAKIIRKKRENLEVIAYTDGEKTVIHVIDYEKGKIDTLRKDTLRKESS